MSSSGVGALHPNQPDEHLRRRVACQDSLNPKLPSCDRTAARPNCLLGNDMTSSAYLPFLIQAVLAAAITGGVIGASHLFGQRARKNKIKDSAYECGVPAEGVVHTRFSVKFYLTALLFMLFDLHHHGGDALP